MGTLYTGTRKVTYHLDLEATIDEDIHIENTFAESPNNLVDTLGRPTDWTHLPVGDLN